MLAQPLTSSSLTPLREASPINCKLLISREQYTTCHIQVPESSHRLPAICLDHDCYSFFKTVKTAQKTLELVIKLGLRGDRSAITQTKLGYIIWVYEPEAKRMGARQKVRNSTLSDPIPSSCIILASRNDYTPCYIRVSDFPEQLPAIQHRDNYYSLFRKEPDAEQVLTMAAKLTRRGDEVLIAPAKEGYALCILEPAAIVTQP